MNDRSELESELQNLLEQYHIPGAALAVLDEGQVTEIAAGTANLRTRIPATPDTLFLIGSITKVLTTSLVMQLVDAGRVELDAPVRAYLPDLQLSDESAAASLAVRHLLTHTNGIAGDYLDDFGRGEDAVARYVASFGTLPMLTGQGGVMSYSNSAFVLAGHLIERLTGQTWDVALRERLLDPAGMEHTRTLPEEVLRYRVAPAHRPNEASGQLEVGEMWPEFHAGAPAGFTPYSTPADLLRFVQIHLNDGRTPDGTVILSPASVAAMQAPQVNEVLSGSFDAVGWGLGWALFRYGTERVIGHNGGASATLRVLPDQRYAVAVLTNASGGVRLASDLVRGLVQRRFGLDIPGPPAERAGLAADQLERYVGSYAHLGYMADVTVEDGRLVLSTSARGSAPGERIPLEAVSDRVFVGEFGPRGLAKVGFGDTQADGRPGFIHIGLRVYNRDA